MNDLKTNWQQKELPLAMSDAEINKMADAYLDYTLNTSIQAYHSVNHSKKERDPQGIFDGVTRIISSEIQQNYLICQGSVTSSFKKLTDDGVIECVGIRKNFRGRNQKV